MSKEKYRSRVHMLLLYPDNAQHAEALEKIPQLYDYAMILHDKDIAEDGQTKKAAFAAFLFTEYPDPPAGS